MLDQHIRLAYIARMTLNEYLSTEGITETAFAGLVGISQPHVNRLRKGAWPSLALISRIYRATDGKVTADDFINREECNPKNRR